MACLTSGEAGALGAITPALVFDAMKRLSWPRSVLVVQPPGGETLVNLETNFYTENTAPTTQTITLLGQRVEIEATPGSYVWHWGAPGGAGNSDDSGSERTSSPGTPYPDLTVTHTYRDADITVHPWVDTVYEGRYRVNGGGWTSIPRDPDRHRPSGRVGRPRGSARARWLEARDGGFQRHVAPPLTSPARRSTMEGGGDDTVNTSVYPVRVQAHLDPTLSRWLWLVKWLLAIPHFVVLAFLWVAFVVLTRRRVLRDPVHRPLPAWHLRLQRRGAALELAGGVLLLRGAGHRPVPAVLAATSDPDYPAHLEVDYPERLSHGLVLVKSWLLAIPHYLVVGPVRQRGLVHRRRLGLERLRRRPAARADRAAGPRGGRRPALHRSLPPADLRLRARHEPLGAAGSPATPP